MYQGLHTTCIGVYQGLHLNNVTVTICEISGQNSDLKISIQKIIQRVRKLAQGLHNQKPNFFRTLHNLSTR